MNAAARLIYSSSRFDHITLLLRQLHWLKAKERIDFKLAVLIVFKCVHGSAPPYLTDELSRPADPKCDADFARHRHLHPSFVELALRPWVIGHFRSLRHVYEAIFHNTLSRHLPFECLKIVWRLIYFLLLFLNLYFIFCEVPARWLLSLWTL